MPHRLRQIDNCAVFAHAYVRVAAGVPALFTAKCGDGLGPFAAFAFALKGKGKYVKVQSYSKLW